jgi:hypothetical protein
MMIDDHQKNGHCHIGDRVLPTPLLLISLLLMDDHGEDGERHREMIWEHCYIGDRVPVRAAPQSAPCQLGSRLEQLFDILRLRIRLRWASTTQDSMAIKKVEGVKKNF